MTYQELLALAARAHGGLEYVDEMGWIHVNPDGTRGAWWNPLMNDGDALRLAVRLGISVYLMYEDFVCADRAGIREYWEYSQNDLYSATRRVIVTAAAAIGKAAP